VLYSVVSDVDLLEISITGKLEAKIQDVFLLRVIPAVRPLILTTWTSPMTTAYYRSRTQVPRDHVHIFIRDVAKSCNSSFYYVVF
jgi:hypothetical protein